MITAAQRAARRSGIGSSDAPAIVLGHDGFKGALAIYADKVLPLQKEDTDNQKAAGTILEPAIRELASRALSCEIRTNDETIVHPEHPWMLAHLDGEVADGGILECKALDWRKAKMLGEPGTDECLRPHFIQVQHQMEVTKRPWAHVAYLVSPYDLRLFLVPRDEEVGGMIADREGRFWRENVLARVPPDPTDADEQLAFNTRLYADATKTVLRAPAGSSAEEALRELANARAARKAAQEIEKLAIARVQALMGTARRIDCDFGHVTWSRGQKTAWAAVVKELGGAPKRIVEKHTKPNARFLPSFDDGDSGADDGSHQE